MENNFFPNLKPLNICPSDKSQNHTTCLLLKNILVVKGVAVALNFKLWEVVLRSVAVHCLGNFLKYCSPLLR